MAKELPACHTSETAIWMCQRNTNLEMTLQDGTPGSSMQYKP